MFATSGTVVLDLLGSLNMMMIINTMKLRSYLKQNKKKLDGQGEADLVEQLCLPPEEICLLL